jgi:hypothetical protein
MTARRLSRSEQELRRKVDQARVAASILKGAGEHFYAQQVLDLCRSAEALRMTCSALHADNMALRR